MKVVVVGAGGMLGAVTVPEWRDHGHEVIALTRADLDVTKPREVAAVVGAIGPDVLINCTAYNRVDDAEDEPSAALSVNAWAVRHLARAAAGVGATFVHYSTDFVFDGATDRPYVESDTPNPQSAYGASKLIGEWFALEQAAAYVLRVESLFGGSASRSTIDRMIKQVRAGQAVKAFSDRTVSPSYVPDVARATRWLIERGLPNGLYHCVNSDHATWVEVAGRIQEWTNSGDARVVPVRAGDIAMRARRPKYAALSSARLARLGVCLPPWTDALRRHLGLVT